MTRNSIARTVRLFGGTLLLVSGATFAQTVTISRDSTLQATASTDAAAVGQVKQGTSAEVIGKQGAWINVKTSAGTGWIYSFNVTYPSGAGPAASGTPARRSAPVTATAGIRGLEKEQMKNAEFNGAELDKLDSFASDSGAGAKPRPKK